MIAINARQITRNLVEAQVIVVLVLLLFFLLMRLLDNVFPQGTTLSQFMSEAGVFKDAPQQKNINDFTMELTNPSGRTRKKSDDSRIVATLQSIHKVVKSKRAGNLTWEPANVGRQLYNKDAVQTFKNSTTKILFDNNSYIDLGENSLIIIKQLGSNLTDQSRNARLILSSGRFFSMLRGTRSDPIAMEITTGDTVANIQSTNPSKPAGFKVQVNPDKSSTITVVEGSAIISSEGQSVEVNQNQAITIATGTELQKPVSPPDPIVIVGPRPDGVFSYYEMPRSIEFVWRQQPNTDGYTIQIARDKYFRDIITNETISNNYFTHNNLKKGKYYWRVRGNIGWIEGRYSKTHLIYVQKDISPPSLNVTMPHGITRSSTVTIKGSTEASIKIFVNERPVKVENDGSFIKTINLQQGPNLIIVEAMDKAGNINYQSKIVNVIGN